LGESELMMKILIFLLFLLTFVVGGVMAVDQPPSFENEQFYGDVTFAVGQTAPASVVVKVGTNSFSSSITEVKCDTICKAHYGYGAGNILRVVGTAGVPVVFYVDDVLVKEMSYVSGAAMKLDFDVTTSVKKEEALSGQTPVTNIPSSCSPSWNCSKWTACDGNGNKTQYCEDVKRCDPLKWNTTETKKCVKDKSGNFPVTVEKPTVVCVYQWYCTAWSTCFNGKQTRGCSQTDKCDADMKAGKVTSIIKYPQPSLSKGCVEDVIAPVSVPQETALPPKPIISVTKKESCSDGILNQNEEDVDCGGSCKACPVSDNGWIWYLLLSVIIIVILGVGGYFFWKSRQSKGMNVDTTIELRSAYDRGMQRGISEEEVTQKLIERGWDRRQLDDFLRRNR